MSVILFASCLLLASSGASNASVDAFVKNPKYHFDALSRIRAIQEPSGMTRWMVRDLGSRTQAETTMNLAGGIQTAGIHRYDGWRRIATSEGAGEKRFVFGRALDELLVQESGGNQFAPIVSSLGSTMKLMNSTGSIADQFRYDAYGAPLAGDTKAFSHLFAGAIYNHKAKLYDLRHRHYDPQTGRFLSRDPLGMHADSFNLGNGYSYVGNNPLTRRDPLGLMGNEWWENALQITCGVGEMVGGAAVAAASTIATPFTAGASTAGVLGGGALFGHGADQFIAGVRSAWTGEDVPTMVEAGVQAVGEAAGLSPEDAAALATGVDAGLGTALSFGASGPLNGARGAVAFAGLAGDGTRAIAKPVAVVAAELTGQAAAKGAAVGQAARAAAALTEPALMTGKEEGPGESKDCPDALERFKKAVARDREARESKAFSLRAHRLDLQQLRPLLRELRKNGLTESFWNKVKPFLGWEELERGASLDDALPNVERAPWGKDPAQLTQWIERRLESAIRKVQNDISDIRAMTPDEFLEYEEKLLGGGE